MKRAVVVFDLDGVLFKSPSQGTVHNLAFWHEYWTDIAAQNRNQEMFWLAATLAGLDVQIVILTARPHEYVGYTLRALQRSGIGAIDATLDMHLVGGVDPFLLVMWPHLPSAWDDGVTSAASFWKQGKVQAINSRADVMFVVEDYKPNAEAIRNVVPVLLYEAKRPR